MNASDLSRLQTEIATQGVEIKNESGIDLINSTNFSNGEINSIPTVVTPRAVPITAGRLQEIISLYTTKLGHITEVPTEDPSTEFHHHQYSNSTISSTASDPETPTPEIPVARIFAVVQPTNNDDDQVPMTTNTDSSIPSSTPTTTDDLPRKGPFKRLRRFWKKHRQQIIRTTLLILTTGAVVAVFVVSPIAGIFIVGNLLLVFGAGTLANAAHSSWASTNTVHGDSSPSTDTTEIFST